MSKLCLLASAVVLGAAVLGMEEGIEIFLVEDGTLH